MTFDRVRMLGTNHAIYAAAASELRGTRIMRVYLGDAKQIVGTYEIDFGGGASEPVDLRDIPAPPVNLSLLLQQREKRESSGQRPETPRKSGVTVR